jgi:hypothetical protein
VNPRHRPARVRFYFDADVLGLAKVIAALRPDVTYPATREASSTDVSGRTVLREVRLT